MSVGHFSVCTISIHAPREGSDALWPPAMLRNCQFLSTLPARGATRLKSTRYFVWQEISIHAPREGSDVIPLSSAYFFSDFYPRSPRGERLFEHKVSGATTQFLSTLPARGATAGPLQGVAKRWMISIHAPREGSDACRQRGLSCGCISIHAPREGSDAANIV